MIYYKKKNLVKKIINVINEKAQDRKLGVFSFFKFILFLFFVILIGLYASYLYLVPKFIDENNAKNIINNYVLKNSKLTLDTKNLTVKPDYKLNINISADYLNLNYPNKKTFISINKPNADINLLSLIYGYIDLNKIKTNDISINTTFTKENNYECFKYFDLKQKNKNSKFKLRNINLTTEKLLLNIYDENINKTFNLKTSKLKITSSEYKKPLSISTSGTISSSNNKLNDFTLNLSIKLNPNSVGKFKEKLAKLNYNPLAYADKYQFYSQSDIDLKINPQNKKSNITGQIALKNYSFIVNGLRLPQNNIVLTFKNNKIYTNCDINLIKKQFIKIKSTISISKNKFIEAQLNSNEINLADFSQIFDIICQVFNLKFKSNEISLNGNANLDLYLKSNFKTITSNGKLLVQNANISHKKTGLNIKNINSNINFENNTVNIYDTSAFINDAKFNLTGTIDNKTNLNLKLNSDAVDIAQVINLIKELPLSSLLVSNLNNYSFNSGLLKINSTINGTLENPIIKTNSTLENLKVLLKEQNIKFNSQKITIKANPEKNILNEIFFNVQNSTVILENKTLAIPNLNFKVLNDSIIISNIDANYAKIPLKINGTIKNFKTKQNEVLLNIKSDLAKNYDIFELKNNLKSSSSISIKQDKLTILQGNVTADNKNIAQLVGNISNLSKKTKLTNLKLFLNDNIAINFPSFFNTSLMASGVIEANGEIEKPILTGKLNLYNINSKDYNLNIDYATLILKNSKYYLNIKNGQLLDLNFNLLAQANYDKKISIEDVYFETPYINITSLNKALGANKSNQKNFIDVENLKGNIATVEFEDLIINNLSFQGKLQKNSLQLSNFNGETLNGKIEGTGEINLLNQKINTKLKLEELNIRQLSNNLKQLFIATSGKVSALINAKFEGFDIENILETFDGEIKFNINNGELSQFAKLERFLQAGNILSQGISKLTLNSTLSTITKQNTGDFKTIEGMLNIKNSIAQIQHINTQGTNMSLHIAGEYNILNNYANLKILGRIPNSIVNTMGSFGSFSFDKLTGNNKTSNESKLATKLTQEEIEKILPLAYSNETTNTKEFVVYINGLADNLSSIQNFKWHIK